MGFWSRCRSALSVVFEEIFPFAPYVRRKTRNFRLAKCKRILAKPQYEQYPNLNVKKLRKRLIEERQRASSMDEKTFKMTLSLSVGLAILGTTSATLVKQISLPEARIALVTLIILGLFYLLSSGYIALGALKTLPSYGYGTQPLLLDSEQHQRNLAECLARAEKINIVRHLRNETAYQCLRNGLVLLYLAAVIFVVFLVIETLGLGWWESGTSTAKMPSSGAN